jgi:hypothetical protein
MNQTLAYHPSHRIFHGVSQRIAITTFVLGALVTANLTAHPNHSAHCEMEWNEDSGRIEVAFQLQSYDLERALHRFHGKAVDLEKSTDLEHLLKDYFAENVYVEETTNSTTTANRKSQRSELHWVGFEFNPKTAWAYFELETDGSPDGKVLTNSVLLGVIDQQTNVVELGMGHRVMTLQFDEQHTERRIDQSAGKLRFEKSSRR